MTPPARNAAARTTAAPDTADPRRTAKIKQPHPPCPQHNPPKGTR
ncbi:hypothetical protein [Streptomyces sp. NPDC021096]